MARRRKCAAGNDDATLTRAREVLRIEMEGLRRVREQLGAPFVALVDRCVKTVRGGGKIVLTGVGKSAHIARKIAATLSSTGSPAVFMHPVEAMHGDLGVLAGHDLLVALSYSGETDELLAVLPAAKRFRVPVAAITGRPDSRLAEWSDLTVPVTVPREACPFNLAPTTSTTAMLALGDALALVLLDRHGFDRDDYARLHPAGAIGRSISLRVGDVMRTGERVARVAAGATVREALLAMTQARSGCVCVVYRRGRLDGIFTDGDFRRHITADIGSIEARVGDLMTCHPITVRASALAIELLKLLEERRIDDVVVVDERGRLAGVVDIQDLPKFKLM